jgi:hypothetical protein
MIKSSNNSSRTANCQIKSGHIQLRRPRNNQQSIIRQHYNNKFDLLNNELNAKPIITLDINLLSVG